MKLAPEVNKEREDPLARVALKVPPVLRDPRENVVPLDHLVKLAPRVKEDPRERMAGLERGENLDCQALLVRQDLLVHQVLLGSVEVLDQEDRLENAEKLELQVKIGLAIFLSDSSSASQLLLQTLDNCIIMQLNNSVIKIPQFSNYMIIKIYQIWSSTC